MVPEHPNATLARRIWDAAASGDANALSEVFAPDLVWRTYGDNPIAGEFKGIWTMLDYVARFGESVSDLRSDLQDILASDRGAIIHCRVTATRGPKQLDSEFLLLLRIDDGRVSEVSAVPMNQKLNDEFWRFE